MHVCVSACECVDGRFSESKPLSRCVYHSAFADFGEEEDQLVEECRFGDITVISCPKCVIPHNAFSR